MLRSMTGYGRSEAKVGARAVTVEVRSLNHRFCEVGVRLPREFSPLEDRIRKLVQARLARGRVEVHVSARDVGEGARRVKVDKGLAMAYYKALRELESHLDIDGSWGIELIAGLPEVLGPEEEEQDVEAAWPPLMDAVSRALDGVVLMREREGQALREDLLHRIQCLEQVKKAIEERAPLVLEEYRQKLKARAAELLGPGATPDEGRLALEVALFAERSSIAEELVRLSSHLAQMAAVLEGDEPMGRRLEFLLQEVNREVNTIGSKTSDLDTIRLVLEAKGELEKMREQAQNIE
ncbi:MAG: YicC family protein [Acetobacteraceae bacterium]|nr:YicC family protein [Acetobacteraceae bacterium]